MYALTYILVTSSKHNLLIYSKNVASREAISPPSVGQISDGRPLRIRIVFVRPRSIPSIEANLHKFKLKFRNKKSDQFKNFLVNLTKKKIGPSGLYFVEWIFLKTQSASYKYNSYNHPGSSQGNILPLRRRL